MKPNRPRHACCNDPSNICGDVLWDYTVGDYRTCYRCMVCDHHSH